MKHQLSEEVIRKLNLPESLPETGFKRNTIYYNLVANTNCLLGAVLSGNSGAIEILCLREKEYISELRANHNHAYLDLCERFLLEVSSLS